MTVIKSTDDISHTCLTPDFTRKLVSASELMVHSFNYLGSCITTEGGAETDIKVRIGKARSAFDFVWPEYLHYLSQTGVMEAGESVDVFISHSPAL
jgi:hypothetical protein